MTVDMERVAIPNDDDARETLERLRWPNGPVCPHCGVVDSAYKIKPMVGSSTRKGLWKCRECRKQFTVTVGTVFADTHIKLGVWVAAIKLMAASKKGISAHQLHRMLGITYKSAWFMAHRIRLASTKSPLAPKLRGVVEVDETYVGGKDRNRHAHKRKGITGGGGKTAVLALVERGGDVNAMTVRKVTGAILKPMIEANVDKGARLITDSYFGYRKVGQTMASHETVNHGAGEYVRGDVHTNTAEGFFSLLKRGIVGTFHHVDERHLWRYVDEFAFRYNNRIARGITDGERAARLIQGAAGKRLTYKPLVNKFNGGLAW
jgi:transposase-like protein